tara:strand:+ start:310 stop:597 length:288 start_codon:yes stop_codon:yes gene_type:complete
MINDELINKLSKLAKLKFDDNAKEKIKIDLDKIIKFIDKLEEVNTDNVDPLVYLSEEINNFRDDTVKDEVSQKEALKNAPQNDSDYFKVPTVLKK